jgi:hypothetical protein
MSLVYAKKSDEIECARLVFIHGNCITVCEPKCVVPSYLMYLSSRFVWLRSYESFEKVFIYVKERFVLE